MSIVTREGNPKNIQGWEDLIRDDVKVIVANPKTAGVARWIFLALWGHKLNKGEEAAKKYVTKVFDNVEIMPRDAREASDVFYSQKFGDVLLTYENEAVFTNLVVSPQNPLPYINPPNNIRVSILCYIYYALLYDLDLDYLKKKLAYKSLMHCNIDVHFL